MNDRTSKKERCRGTVSMIGAAALGLAFFLAPLPVLADNDLDCPSSNATENPDCGTHNMMLVGKGAAYLSHLPMFHSEHRFQLIVETTFDKGSKSVDRLYMDDRKDHPEIGMYTVSPGDLFVLSRLFTPENRPQRTAFSGTVFRGHLERGGEEIEGLQGVDVHIMRVVYARELKPGDARSDELRYILFGDGKEFFLAHQITQAPDFDQIILVKVDGHDFTADELRSGGVIVTVPGRANSAAKRLRTDESVVAAAEVTGGPRSLKLQLDVDAEPYFEEGELRARPTFDSTPLEKDVGF